MAIATPDLQKVGGLSIALQIAQYADEQTISIAPHNISSPVGPIAAAHLCAAIPNASFLELWHDPPCMTGDVFQWYLREPLRIDAEGMIAVPQKPGLGVELDEEKLEKYR